MTVRCTGHPVFVTLMELLPLLPNSCTVYNNSYNDKNNNNTNNNIITITKNKFVIFTTLVWCTVLFELEVTLVGKSLPLVEQ